jgi:shikimate dehydrogenase
MKKYLVIGNPIEHSMSPKLHNYWIKINNLDATYNKQKVNEDEIQSIIAKIKNGEIDGINVTVPFKKSVISFLDELTPLADQSKSVNIIFKNNNKLVGGNTDVGGFENGLNHINYKAKGKKVFILGAGGVVPSIMIALKKLGVSQISLSNRTKQKAEDLKKIYPNLEIVDWGTHVEFDIIINATSLGLKPKDRINLEYKKLGSNKLFYDVIYNPQKTNFLLNGEKLGNKIANGKIMFIYQAQLAFNVWHNILPEIDKNTLDLF